MTGWAVVEDRIIAGCGKGKSATGYASNRESHRKCPQAVELKSRVVGEATQNQEEGTRGKCGEDGGG